MGLALSDGLGLTAQPLDTLERKSDEGLVERVRAVFEEKEAEGVVVGLPRNMDGTEGPMAAAVRDFATRLEEELGVSVDFWDERLTSWEAEELLRGAGLSVRKAREKGRVDRMAAQIMLQSYLEARRRQS